MMFEIELLAYRLLIAAGLKNNDFQTEPLFGDASGRQYFRIRSGDKTVIMMKVADVKPGEFGRGDSFTDFETLDVMLKEIGLNVPKILAVNHEQKVMLLEDLGDTTLFELIKSDPSQKLSYVKSAIELLAQMQQALYSRKSFDTPADKRQFTKKLFMEEFYHFYEYMIEKRVYHRSFRGLWKKLEKDFKKISTELSKLPYIFSHRDFQSKNIMISEKKQYLIDFQDALMAPAVYDLVAILRDSYIILKESEIEMLLAHFWSINHVTRELFTDYESFERAFHLQALQRKMKDCGRFIYLHQVKGKEWFLPYVVPTLGHVRNTLIRLDMEKLANRLAPFIEELQIGEKK